MFIVITLSLQLMGDTTPADDVHLIGQTPGKWLLDMRVIVPLRNRLASQPYGCLRLCANEPCRPELRRAQQPVRLTGRECRPAELLIRAGPRPVSIAARSA